MESMLEPFYWRMVVASLVIIALSTVVSGWVFRRLSLPLEDLQRGSERLASGVLEPKLAIADATEIGRVAEAVNRLALELDEKSIAFKRYQQEQESILSSITEAILVFDDQGRIQRINHAAEQLLGKDAETLIGRSPLEALGHEGMNQLVTVTISNESAGSKSSMFAIGSGNFVEARGAALRDSFGNTTGALFVLEDRTRLRKLEELRHDFVASVSHELKTPLTAIKGFADTLLLQGSLSEPNRVQRFVSVIAEQAERLQGLVESLMNLARLEQDGSSGKVERSWCHLNDILSSAAYSVKSSVDKDINVEIDCPQSLTARLNPGLLERAVANLVDNAVRYGGSSCTVYLTGHKEEGDIVVTVRDDGKGIDRTDLERIFERFYRVAQDKVRHPEGSGLGLSIVKYVALAHGGSVDVESEPGHGSTFYIRVPAY